MSGGLAGVASKARGESIKVVNDQVDYSLWEFYYDPTKDMKQALPGGTGLGGPAGPTKNSFGPGLNNANALPASPAAAPGSANPQAPGNQNAPAPSGGAASPANPPPTGAVPVPNDVPTATDSPAPDNMQQGPYDNPPQENTAPQ